MQQEQSSGARRHGRTTERHLQSLPHEAASEQHSPAAARRPASHHPKQGGLTSYPASCSIWMPSANSRRSDLGRNLSGSYGY